MTAAPVHIVLFGHTGKVGSALHAALGPDYAITGVSRDQCDVSNPRQVEDLIAAVRPTIVINAVAHGGIDACEDDPATALAVNTLFPKLLAQLSVREQFRLLHFSSDAVFNGESDRPYNESDRPRPINIYGFTKYGADCFIEAIATSYYIVRISTQFGLSLKPGQFVEKMLEKVRQGQRHLQISADIVASPSYSRDIATAVKDLLQRSVPYGLYHMANSGTASLHELMAEIIASLGLAVTLEPVSHRTFPSRGLKNTYTPLTSGKLPLLRPWQEAVQEYCSLLQQKRINHG